MLNEKSEKTNLKVSELYTKLSDVEREMSAYIADNPNIFRDKTVLLPFDNPQKSNFTKYFARNFENFGLKKIISTSSAYGYKNKKCSYENSFFEKKSDYYVLNIHKSRGKIFSIDRESYISGLFEIGEPEWWYLEGDGDFRSDEIKNYRNEADIIITYPPCLLFEEFLSWIFDAGKKFILITDRSCIEDEWTSELMKNNKMRFGKTECSSGFWFETKNYDFFDKAESKINQEKIDAVWITNLD